MKAREIKKKVKQETMLNTKGLKTPGIYSMEINIVSVEKGANK